MQEIQRGKRLEVIFVTSLMKCPFFIIEYCKPTIIRIAFEKLSERSRESRCRYNNSRGEPVL